MARKADNGPIPCAQRVPLPGWRSISLKEELLARVERFIVENDDGYSNRAEVIAAAVRKFIDDYYARRAREAALRRAPGAGPRRRGGPRGRGRRA